MENIKCRHGGQIAINVPIFQDINTPKPFTEFIEFPAALPDCIFMDASFFGVGCCALQVTVQAYDQTEAVWLYDQFLALSPILLTLR